MLPLEVENLNFAYETRNILENISFTIQPGTVTSILGPNGSGKTTLLKLLLGLHKPANGTIKIFGNNLNEITLVERARKMAYVPQRHNAIFSYKVRDVVAMGRLPYSGIFCHLNDADFEHAQLCMNKLGIEHLAERPYTEISGGEQQLALIARALTQEAKILVLDEPVAGLDYGNQLLLLKQLRNLARSGITCIKTTHYPEHALWTSDRAIFLKAGKIIAAGRSEEIINPEMLKILYNADIMVIETNTGAHKIRTCVPEFDS
ncbi:MAG: ABC transporter ATP-binding protein [Erysipelotrichia bacterium]|nr:ABC transporter ATP-binding protein [Erysipelotrichia bacterium]